MCEEFSANDRKEEQFIKAKTLEHTSFGKTFIEKCF